MGGRHDGTAGCVGSYLAEAIGTIYSSWAGAHYRNCPSGASRRFGRGDRAQADAGLDQMTLHLNGKVNALLDQGKEQTPWGAAGPSGRGPRGPDAQEPAPTGAPGRPGGTTPLAGGLSESPRWSAPRSDDMIA